MARVLITGMSGTGKSTLLVELHQRGHLTVDTDYDNWVLPSGVWDPVRMASLLERQSHVIVSGTVENQIDFYDRFDHIVLLSAPWATLLERVTSRSNNPFGRTQAQQDEIRFYLNTVEPLPRRRATFELDGTNPVNELADAVESLTV
ncbi:AAA family ATPase [Propioniciclava sp. MC1683]|uniref:AAA family ATPase n=1 Tax=Propioniciclava sp. MC1683 TaxID=2760309 RepID=UPI0015FFF602|nr:AAA family ATPase [Propioniciclava sp. MC1683]MBB1503076.1 AAA family ATPase [Propioniciclava sp. MC1683]